MKAAIVSAALFAAVAVLSGCMSNSDTEDPNQNVVTSNAPPITQAPKTQAAAPQPPPVPDPKGIFDGAFEYSPSGNTADQQFTVPAGAETVVASFTVHSKASGPYSVQGENGQGKPSIVLVAPGGEETPASFDPASAGLSTTDGGQEIETFEVELEGPLSGGWTLGVRGSGTNVVVDATLTAYFE